MDTPVVEPKPGVAPVAETPAPTAPEGEQAAGALPDDLIRIPAIQGLLAGSPPAVSASLADFANRPEGQLIAANKDPLMAAGMGLYRSIAGDTGVLFNRMYVSDTEISDADKAGNLAQIAPSFDEVNQSISTSGDKHPILNPDLKPPTGLKTAPPPAIGGAAPITPSAGATAAPAPSPAPARQIGAKARNVAPGSPTSGPKPGAGRLMNQILKPVI